MGREALITLGWVVGGVGALALLWGMWWALFADRSRGERRCPKCWHLIAPGGCAQCPECGRAFRGEHDLLRTRRRWPVAAACVMMLLAGTLWLRVQLTDNGWWRLLPQRALVAIVPWLGDTEDGSMARGHLRMMLLKDELTDDNAVRLLALLREGDADARPGTDAWRRRYAPWLDALRGPRFWSGYGSRAGPREAAMAVAPSVSLVHPAVWVVDTPLVLTTEIDDWLPDSSGLSLELLDAPGLPIAPDALETLRARRWERRGGGGFGGGFPVTIGALPKGSHDGAVRFRWRAFETEEPARTLASGEILAPLRIEVRDALPALAPVTDAFVDERVRQVFLPGLIREEQVDAPRFAFSYRPIETAGSSLRDIAFGFVVEACERGVPRRTLHVWWRGDQATRAGYEVVQEQPDRLALAQESPDWTLRVRSDETLARRAASLDPAAQTKRFWSGTVEMPLRIERAGQGRFMRRWVPVDAPAQVAPGPR